MSCQHFKELQAENQLLKRKVANAETVIKELYDVSYGGDVPVYDLRLCWFCEHKPTKPDKCVDCYNASLWEITSRGI